MDDSNIFFFFLGTIKYVLFEIVKRAKINIAKGFIWKISLNFYRKVFKGF